LGKRKGKDPAADIRGGDFFLRKFRNYAKLAKKGKRYGKKVKKEEKKEGKQAYCIGSGEHGEAPDKGMGSPRKRTAVTNSAHPARNKSRQCLPQKLPARL